MTSVKQILFLHLHCGNVCSAWEQEQCMSDEIGFCWQLLIAKQGRLPCTFIGPFHLRSNSTLWKQGYILFSLTINHDTIITGNLKLSTDCFATVFPFCFDSHWKRLSQHIKVAAFVILKFLFGQYFFVFDQMHANVMTFTSASVGLYLMLTTK